MENGRDTTAAVDEAQGYDTGSHEEFVAYYEAQSQSDRTRQRSIKLRDTLLELLPPAARSASLDIADVGGGAGAFAMVWAEAGCRAVCVDINASLIEIGSERARQSGLDVRFEIGTATSLPLSDASCDIVLLLELLEHVADWQSCLDEAVRVLRTGGLVMLSTSNKLCPVQQEFTLPLYSWYPAPLKRYCVRRALADRPQWANYATYPAVNWFTYAGLKQALAKRGCTRFYDRWDLILARKEGGLKERIARILTALPALRRPLRLIEQNSSIVARKG